MVSFSLFFTKKLPQITFGLWIILLLRLVMPAEYGFAPLPFSQALVPQYEADLLHLPQEFNLSHPQEKASGGTDQSRENARLGLQILILLGTFLKLGSVFYRRKKFSSLVLTPIVEGPIYDKFCSWKQRFHIQRKISLFYSSHPYALHTSGFLKPRIILPTDSSKTDQHLNSILVHEFGHILRWDDFFILVSQSLWHSSFSTLPHG